MAVFYQKFLKQNIDLAPLGVEQIPDSPTYFCTPKGASIIGWAGVDGIHFCFIRGFGEMVFAVSPSNARPDYVHPIADSFSDFLRLLLACGDAAALEQAWGWSQEQFDCFLAENPPTQPQQRVLNDIANKMALMPMEQPYQNLKKLQDSFDYSKIRYTEDFDNPDMNGGVLPEKPWKVYFDGNFWGHHGKDRAGTEMLMGQEFLWAGYKWVIPAIYSCSKGLVMDVCMQVDPDSIRAFLDKWDLYAEDNVERQFTPEQQECIDNDNPLCFDFTSFAILNGKELFCAHSSGLSYNPCMTGGFDQSEAKQILEHYELNHVFGWSIQRMAFPWIENRKPVFHTLSVILKQHPVSIPGPHFNCNQPGDQFSFVYPSDGIEHTLTVKELERQTLPEHNFGQERDSAFPRCFTMMSYTVSPDIPEGKLLLHDCADSDSPRQQQPDPMAPVAVTVAVIGGADGPTAVFATSQGQKKLGLACSAMHFEPVSDIEWRMVFPTAQFADQRIELM